MPRTPAGEFRGWIKIECDTLHVRGSYIRIYLLLVGRHLIFLSPGTQLLRRDKKKPGKTKNVAGKEVRVHEKLSYLRQSVRYSLDVPREAGEPPERQGALHAAVLGRVPRKYTKTPPTPPGAPPDTEQRVTESEGGAGETNQEADGSVR